MMDKIKSYGFIQKMLKNKYQFSYYLYIDTIRNNKIELTQPTRVNLLSTICFALMGFTKYHLIVIVIYQVLHYGFINVQKL